MTKSLEVLIIHDNGFIKYSLVHAFLLLSNTRHNILKNFVYSRKTSLIKLHLPWGNITNKGLCTTVFQGTFQNFTYQLFSKHLTVASTKCQTLEHSVSLLTLNFIFKSHKFVNFEFLASIKFTLSWFCGKSRRLSILKFQTFYTVNTNYSVFERKTLPFYRGAGVFTFFHELLKILKNRRNLKVQHWWKPAYVFERSSIPQVQQLNVPVIPRITLGSPQ